MNEYFEESVTAQPEKYKKCIRLKTMYFVFSIVFFVLSAALFVFFPVSPDSCQKFDIIVALPFLISLPLTIFFFFYFNKKSKRALTEYDYRLSGDQLIVSQIFNRNARKVFRVAILKTVAKIGRLGSETYKTVTADKGVSKAFTHVNAEPEEGKSLFYLVYIDAGDREVMTLECSDALMIAILRVTGRQVLEDHFQ